MIGLIVVIGFAAVLATLLLGILRNTLVDAVGSLGRLIGSVIEALIKILVSVHDGLSQLIESAFRALRNLHGDEDATYGRFWDIFIPILFVALFAVLAYADYQLFAARIGPLLGLDNLPQNSNSVLNGVDTNEDFDEC